VKALPLPEQSGTVTALSWSPDGTRIAGVCDDGTVLIWKIASGEIVFQQQLARVRLLTIDWSPNGRCIALGGEHSALTILQVRNGALVLSHLFRAPVKKIAWSPQGERFLVAVSRTIYIFHRGQLEPVALEQSSAVRDIAWSPTGSRFASVCEDGTVQVYNALRRREACMLTHVDILNPRCVAWSTDGRDVGIGTASGLLQVHDGSCGQRYTTYVLSSSSIEQLFWSDPYLVAKDQQQHIALWDLRPRELSGELTDLYSCAQRVVAVSPSGEQLATSTKHRIAVGPAREMLHALC